MEYSWVMVVSFRNQGVKLVRFVVGCLVPLVIVMSSCTSGPSGRVDSQSQGAHFIDIEGVSSVSVFDIFSKIEVIPLETTEHSVLTYPQIRLLLHNRNLYVLDWHQGIVVVFDEDGKHKGTIDNRGKGPDEYLSLNDFGFNRFTGHLELMSGRTFVSIYDEETLSFMERIKLPIEFGEAIHYFANVTPDIYAFFNQYGTEKIFFYSKLQNKVVGSTYKLPEYLYRETSFKTTYSPFYVINDSLCFVQEYNGEIFFIDRDLTMQTRNKWNFGEQTINLSKIPANQDMKFYIQFLGKLSTEYAIHFQVNGENSRYIVTRFRYQNRFNQLIYDKRHRTHLLFDSFREGFQCVPALMDEEAIYSVVKHSELHWVVSSDVLDEENRKILEGISPDDNPVIVKYYFK